MHEGGAVTVGHMEAFGSSGRLASYLVLVPIPAVRGGNRDDTEFRDHIKRELGALPRERYVSAATPAVSTL
jgi:hypothetical protein